MNMLLFYLQQFTLFTNGKKIVSGIELTTVSAFCFITTAVMAAFLYNLYRHNNIHRINVKTTVLITGCDSGLGYSFARHCNELGMTVFSCVYNENSLGAKDLKSRKNTYVLKLDVTDKESINNLQTNVNKIVTNQQYDFLGIVNNSGVMAFGEFEWLTEDQIDNQINVNFRGVTHVTKAFLPLLRKYKGRIINVSSHCSMVPLPTLSIYAGTKAAIDAWSSALRMELDKFDVKVITLTPGSYVTQSNIMSKQEEHKEKMKKEMSPEAMDLYHEYFNRFHDYLCSIPCQKGLVYIQDNNLMSKFDQALLSNKPDISYINSPLRYKFYHLIIRFAPCSYLRNIFIRKYMNCPKW